MASQCRYEEEGTQCTSDIKEQRTLHRSASWESTSVGSADSASETEWMCMDDAVCAEKMTRESQVDCRAFAIFEQYGVFGASVGAWCLPGCEARESISEPTSEVVGSSDPTTHGSVAEVETVSDRYQMTEILEHYGVLDAPLGSWKQSPREKGSLRETSFSVDDEADGSVHNPIFANAVESFSLLAFFSCWFSLAVVVGLVNVMLAANFLYLNVSVCAASVAYIHFRVCGQSLLEKADTSHCASKHASHLYRVVVC